MNLPAALAVVIGIAVGTALLVPAARRTGLGIWHPGLAWMALHAVFFGVGAASLALTDGMTAAPLYVAAAAAAFGLGVAAADRLARVRAQARMNAAPPSPGALAPPTGPLAPPIAAPASQVGGIRPFAVAGLVGLGVVALVPTLLSVGIPFLTGDITGARSAIGGLDLQVLRVALPAAVLVAVLVATFSPDPTARTVAVLAFAAAVVAELVLASRYLSAELVAAVILALGIARRPVPLRVLAVVGVVATVLFVGIGILRAWDQAAGREVDFAVGRTVNRILLIEPRTLDALQQAIPAEQPFFDGLTWVRRLAPWLGRADVPNLGYWIYPRMFPDQVVPGYAAPGLVGEAWANFGWIGLAVFAGFGVVVERLGAMIALRRRTVADVAAAALLGLFVARTHALGLDGFAVVAVLVVAWRLLVAPLDGLVGDLAGVLRWRA